MMEKDERNRQIEVMINRQYAGKVRPFEDTTPIPVTDCFAVCKAADFPTPQKAIDWAIERKRLKPDNGMIGRGELLTWAQWRDFNLSFRREKTTAHGLAKAIYRGFAFSPVFNGRRIKDNFIGAWHIALDFDTADTNSALDTLAAIDFSNWFASFGYSTPSSKPEAPKSRLVFIFEKPVTDYQEYEQLYSALLWCFPHADKATSDAVRLFFGSLNCDVWSNWSIMPAGVRDSFITEHAKHLKATAPKPPAVVINITAGKYESYIEAAIRAECDNVTQAPEGSRHDKLLKAATNLGSLVSSTWAGLDEGAALSALIGAAVWARSNEAEELERIIKDGLTYGKAIPRTQPSVTVPDVRDLIRG